VILKNKYWLSFLVFTLPQLMKNLLLPMDGVQTPIIAVVGQLLKAKPGTISLAQGIVS
jgi:hypothetical protein